MGLTSLLLLTCTVQYSTVQTVHVPAALDLGRGLGEAHAGVLQQVGQHHAGGPGVVMVNEVRRQHFAAQITVTSVDPELTSIDAKILFYRQYSLQIAIFSSCCVSYHDIWAGLAATLLVVITITVSAHLLAPCQHVTNTLDPD